MNQGAARRVCPYCGARAVPVHVHGQVQCGACGIDIEPCCDGASAGDEAHANAANDLHADPGLFARLFERLGGAGVTVTRDALLFALVEYTATDLTDGLLLLEAAEHTGRIESAGPDCYRLP